ncbi:uncharacterized protein [Triticum aestivum]|uniref:uncharacterized protein isoform X4 n=1 Tax=Triticum aestivum TaxID=4565 RepID=UPI001D02000F|nr:uncharacterized protein LOC123043811 isoform X4 [Triticum aestivum]
MPPLLQGAGEIGDEDKKQQAGRGGLEVLGGRRSPSWFVMEAAPPARGHRWCARCRIVGAALVRSVCHCSFRSTPAQEAYLQSLSKALSHYHKAQLLLLDITDFSLSRASMRAPVQNQSMSETTFGRVSDFIAPFAMFPKMDEPRDVEDLKSSVKDFGSAEANDLALGP